MEQIINSVLNFIIIIGCLFLIYLIFEKIGLIGKFAKATKGGEVAGSYRERDLMSANEVEFFGRLVAALPEYYVFPQVAMSALIQASSTIGSKAHSDFNRIARLRVDYVIADKNTKIIAVVELDDRTHSRAKDQLRDSRLEQAKIRTVRFQSRNKPDVVALRSAVLGPLAQSDLAQG